MTPLRTLATKLLYQVFIHCGAGSTEYEDSANTLSRIFGEPIAQPCEECEGAGSIFKRILGSETPRYYRVECRECRGRGYWTPEIAARCCDSCGSRSDIEPFEDGFVCQTGDCRTRLLEAIRESEVLAGAGL